MRLLLSRKRRRMSLTESDKVVLTKYPIAPSKCVICLRSSNGVLNFIDFQMSLDIYGSVNICTDCCASVAQLLGYVEKNFLNDADDQIRNLVETNRKLVSENEQLRSTLDSLFNIRPDLKQRNLLSDAKSDEGVKSDDQQLELELTVERTDDRKSTKSNASGRSKNSAFATDPDGSVSFNI